MKISLHRNGHNGRRSESPVHTQIAASIRGEIEAGRLGQGDRLPPIRTLAKQLEVNRDTVALAYERLRRDGAVDARVGRGTFVAKSLNPPEPFAKAPPALAPMVERLLDFEQARPRYESADGIVPLHALIPDPSLYPVKAFRRSLNRALADGGSALLGYGGHQGNTLLRTVMCARLAQHGLQVEPDNVVLCQGASQGISLALRLYAEPGDWVAVEEPTYHNVLAALVGLGLRPAPIPTSEQGPDLAVLERTLARPEVKLFYTMPSFHNPLGTTTPLSRRRELLNVASRLGKPIVEDAFEMDLHYDRSPVPPLAALDTNDTVVHLFSFSKSLFPGVRIGSIAAKGRAIDGLMALKQATDLSGALMLQAAVADFVHTGAYERHLKRLRRTLRERRDVLLETLEENMPAGTRWTRPDGGYQVWLELPKGFDSRALLTDAQRAGVSFSPGYQFYHDARTSRCLRLSTALADAEAIRRGVKRLAHVVRKQLPSTQCTLRDTGIHV